MPYGNYPYIPAEVPKIWKLLSDVFHAELPQKDADMLEHVWMGLLETSKTHHGRYIQLLYSRALQSFYNTFYTKNYWMEIELTEDNMLDSNAKVFSIDGRIAEMPHLRTEITDDATQISDGSEYTLTPGKWRPDDEDNYDRFWEGSFRNGKLTFIETQPLPITYWAPFASYNTGLAAKLFGVLVGYGRIQNWGSPTAGFTEQQYIKALLSLIKAYLLAPSKWSILIGCNAMLYMPTSDLDGIVSAITEEIDGSYTVEIFDQSAKEIILHTTPIGFEPTVSVGESIMAFQPLTDAVRIPNPDEEIWKHFYEETFHIPQDRFLVPILIRDDVPYLSDTKPDVERFLNSILSAGRTWRILEIWDKNIPHFPKYLFGETEVNFAGIALESYIVSTNQSLRGFL